MDIRRLSSQRVRVLAIFPRLSTPTNVSIYALLPLQKFAQTSPVAPAPTFMEDSDVFLETQSRFLKAASETTE